jgi:hypothetical protein
MELINKLPFVFGALMALLIGMIGIMNNSTKSDTLIKMLVGLSVFFVLGTVLKYILADIINENKRKENEAEKEKEEMLKKEAAEKKKKGNNVDLKVEGTDDEKLNYSMTEAIRKSLNQ